MPLEVCEVRQETDAVTVIEVARPDGERLPPYRPGQFISVGIGDLQETRSYSLIGPALEISERYRIAVREEPLGARSEEHTSELQSLMRSSSAVFCLKKNKIRSNKKR